jgi:4-amino-4-deoxy-L-arabinose transferase-like glycosyltransferase
MLLAVLAAMRLRRKPSLASFLLAGTATGLAVAALHYGAFVLFALLAAVVLAARAEQGKAVRHVAGLGLALFVVAAFFRWSYPFYFEPNSGLLRLEQAKG